MAKRCETHGAVSRACVFLFLLSEEDNAGLDLRKGQAGRCISSSRIWHSTRVPLAGGFVLRCRSRAGGLLLASHFCPPFPLRVRDRTACLRAENTARFGIGGCGGRSPGRLAGGFCLAALGEDRARLSQCRNFFIDGIQYLIVQGGSFRAWGALKKG
jgi:hypothetical protein